MDRRTTLAKLMGRKQKAAKVAAVATAPMPPAGLEPYTGPFEYEQAAHLLRRTMFGPTYEQIKTAADAGLDTVIGQLLADSPLPDKPLNYNYEDDPNVPVGESWVGQPYTQGLIQDMQVARRTSFISWFMQNWLNEGISIREKMTLFWHNHFVTGDNTEPHSLYIYTNTLRSNALGNFRELAKAITIDPAMLVYLNGTQNTAVAPNENYARELLELFTIGKGPQVGPGDYTNYTEDDVVQMARILTGWRIFGVNSTDPDNVVRAEFRPNRHDQGAKQLSERFDNIVIENMGEEEYAHLIDIIYTKDECARFICRKLYRWFVYYKIDAQVEADVIEPMAQILIDNDYEILPAVEALLRSEHFFDHLSIGPMIKHPVDFVISAIKSTQSEVPSPNLEVQYLVPLRLFRNTFEAMQMVPYNPPSVAGWKAWYQEPTFYRNWINTTSLGIRSRFSNTLLSDGFGIGQQRIRIDSLAFVQVIENAFEPNDLIDEFVKILFPQPITEGQRDVLKEILIPGLPDYEWTVEYSAYTANPTDPDLSTSVRNKLNALLNAMFSLPEFYLS